MKLRWIAALAAIALWCVPARGQGTQNVKGSYGCGSPTASNVVGDVGSRYIDTCASPPVEWIITAINLNSPPAVGNSNGTGVPSATWTQGGGGGGLTQYSKNIIDAANAPYNVTPGQTIYDATFVSGQNTISCPNNDCNFTAANNGQICFGTNLTTDTSAITSATILPVGVLTVTGAQTATCSGGNATASPVGSGVLVWGPDSTAGTTAAWAATVAVCGTIQLPSGLILTTTGQINANNSTKNCNIDGTSGYGYLSAKGAGPSASLFVPTPSFDQTTCTGGNLGTGCFFGAKDLNLQNVGIWGAGQNPAGLSGKIAVQLNTSTTGNNQYLYSVLLTAWGAGVTGFTGFGNPLNSDLLLEGVHLDGVGDTGCSLAGPSVGAVFMFNVFCAVNKSTGLHITGGTVYSFGGVYGFTSSISTPSVIVDAGATLWSFGDSMPYTTGSGQTVFSVNGTAYLDGSLVSNPATNGFGCAAQASGNGIIHARGSKCIGGGTGSTGLFVGSTGKFFDEGGNTITGVSANYNIQAGGALIGEANSANQTIVTAAKTVLSAGWGNGPATVTALSGGNAPIQFTITNTGAGQGASPTITYTFPTAYPVAPYSCTATQTGGTNATGTFTTSALSATGVTFTFSLTPTAAATEIVQVTCVTP